MLMGKFRDNMKWIMLVTAITFVGLMVFGWGMDITGRSSSGASGGELGRVNGEPISYQEWATTYRSLYQQAQKKRPGQQISAAENREIENSAWDQLVMQKLVNQELHRRGIDVTEAEIRQAARFAPPPEFTSNELFQTNGQFDISKYHQFLSSPMVDNQLLLQLEAYYRDVIPRSKLFYQVTSGTYMPESQMWQVWSDANEKAKARFIVIDPNVVVPDASVTVTDKEIERYYKDHQDEFKVPATAQVRFITIDRSPTAADSAKALERARRVRQEALTNFADVAKRESADSGSARQGGSLGKIRRGQTVPAFEQAAFSQPLNQVSEPVLTEFGYHIVKVTARTNDEAETSHILIPIERSQDYDNHLLDRADSLETLAQDLPLEKVGARLGLRVRQGELNDSTPYLAGVGDANDAAAWVFKDGEVGENSEVYETPNVYYIVEIVTKREAGVSSLGDATPVIRERIKTKKKVERAQEFARTVLEKIRGGATFDEAALQFQLQAPTVGPFTRLEFVPGVGRQNAAVGTAFGLKPGQTSGIVEADDRLFIVQTLERIAADRKEFDQQKEGNRGRLTQVLAEQRWNDFLTALKEQAKIVDNRSALQKAQAKADATT